MRVTSNPCSTHRRSGIVVAHITGYSDRTRPVPEPKPAPVPQPEPSLCRWLCVAARAPKPKPAKVALWVPEIDPNGPAIDESYTA
jgi:hypothetical protein